MTGKAVDEGVARAGVGRDAAKGWVITALAGVMAAAGFASIAIWGHNIPLAEDWAMVPALTGQVPDLAGWLWSQNNEHRLPVQRAIYLLLLLLTQDFRSAMVLNVALLLVLALAMARVAAHLRGRPAWQDAIFPLALLHLGHWENLVWSWQIQFVWSSFLVGCLLCLLVAKRGPIATGSALAASLILPLLVLSGANGIVQAAVMSPWLLSQCLAHFGHRGLGGTTDARSRLAGSILLAGTLAVFAAIGLYFWGYVRPSWSPPLATPVEFMRGAQNYFAYGFGPASRVWALPFALCALGVAVSGALLGLRAVLTSGPSERLRAAGLTLFIGTGIALGLAIALGRGSYADRMPDRYALFSVMPLLGSVFAWMLYSPPRVGRFIVTGLALLFLLLVPLNTYVGFKWRNWYVAGMQRVENDVAAGIPIPELAARHRKFLMHWSEDRLREGMQMLHDAGSGPFRQAVE